MAKLKVDITKPTGSRQNSQNKLVFDPSANDRRDISGAEYLGGALLGGFETAPEAVGGKVGVVGY